MIDTCVRKESTHMPEAKTKVSAAIKLTTPIVLDLPPLQDSTISYTGEDVKTPRLSVPQISVSYKAEDDDSKVAEKGEFIEYDPATKTTSPLGKKITIQILHHRQALGAFKNEISYWTPEIGMKYSVASLFMTEKDKDGKRKNTFLLKGTIKNGGDLRTAYPDLGYRRVLYVLHEGKLKNLVVKGASFSKFIDFSNAIKGQSSSSVNIELTTTKDKKGTVIFYPIVFTPKDPINMVAQEPVLKQLSDWFSKFDALMDEQNRVREEDASIKRGDGPTGDISPAPHRTTAEQVQRPDEEADERAALEAEVEKVFES